MRTRAVPRPVLVVLVIAVAAAVPAVALGSGQQAATDDEPDEDTTGVQLTAYMQSTAEETNASVETGLWVAGIERSGNPDNEIRDRAGDLAARLERLRNRSESLNRTRANASLPPVVYNARAAALDARVSGLQEAVEATAKTADRHGVNVSKLDRLRADARNLTGPEVATIARNLTTHGPPAWAGNGTAGPPGAAGNSTGPPENPGQSGDNGPPGDDPNSSSSGEANPGNDGGPAASGPDEDDSEDDEDDSEDDDEDSEDEDADSEDEDDDEADSDDG